MVKVEDVPHHSWAALPSALEIKKHRYTHIHFRSNAVDVIKYPCAAQHAGRINIVD